MKNRKGQSTLELALTIVAVSAAAIAMSIFLKRSVMGKMRESGDQVGGQFTPLTTTNTYSKSYDATRNEVTNANGSSSSTIVAPEKQSRTGHETVDQELDKEKLFNP